MNKLEEMFKSAKSAEDYVEQYRAHMSSVLTRLEPEAVGRAIEAIQDAAGEDRTVFLMGNGGSGAVGAHWVNDLSANSVVEGRPGYRVMSLTDNPFSVTAVANDASFEEIFELQLKANMRPSDVVVAMSVSGNSPNILRAVEYANENGACTIGCTGFDGGRLRELCQIAIHTPSTKDEYGPVEDVFSVVMHLITTYITMDRGRMLSH